MKRLRGGLGFDGLRAGPDGAPPPERVGDGRPGTTPEESAHGLHLPVNTYPLFENALRARDGRSLAAHQAAARRALRALHRGGGRAIPTPGSPPPGPPKTLSRSAPDNRMVSFPYPKYLNAIMQVDQSAGVLIASVGRRASWACRRTAGCSCTAAPTPHDLWYPLERQDYHSSPAMRLTGERALAMAGIAARRPDVHRPLFLLPLGGGDRRGVAGPFPRRSARLHRHRRAALLRRAGEQLFHARASPR